MVEAHTLHYLGACFKMEEENKQTEEVVEETTDEEEVTPEGDAE